MRGYVGGVPDSRTVFGRLAVGDVESQNFSMNDAWVPMYNVHKTFAGLLDTWADFASIDEQTSQLARTVVLDLADWWCRIAEPLDDETFDRILVSEFGGMCESFAELYARTGEERYHVMADRFKDHAIFDPLAQGEDVLTGMHANTQIPKVLGWERLGAICNDEQADAATNTFWDSVVHHRSVSIGAHSVSEHFHPTDDFSSMIESREGPETCNSYNMSKLAERLWLRSGSADYINFYERVLENHLLSTINPKQPGFVYFTPMRSQHYRAYSTPQECFWCCVGSGLENHARYGRLIYALQRPAAQDSADSAAAGFASSAAETGNTVSNNAEAEATRLLVNLYIDSTFDCPEQGLRITQRAARIEDGVDYTVTFTLESTAEHVPDTPGGLRETTLFLRRPWWAEHYGVMEATCAVCTLDPARTNDIPEGYLPLRLRWQNKSRDIHYIIRHLTETLGTDNLAESHLQVANELFYRNKAAWLVGKLVMPMATLPFLLPIHRSEEGELFVDTCLTTHAEASIVFGFARSYFMVYAPLPGALVEWLREILPGKTTAELYMAIGCQKHAKTESYREYLRYVTTADEQFIEAPGIRGMVMLVFTLPGFDRVFKVIKDRFAPQKEMTAAHVRACYQLVKEHDRVGRMADTQEFENFVLDKQQIDPALIAKIANS